MVVAGLTGGIATGKSTVTALFASFGAAIIDADRIAREVVARGSPAWKKIMEHFGTGVLRPDSELDRERLGSLIFSDTAQKDVLNRIVHPEVFQEMDRRIRELREENRAEVVICDVPLLIETGMHIGFDEVVLVYVPEPLQIRRLMDRDGISRDEAVRKVRAQMSIEEKRAYATIVVDNSASQEETAGNALRAYEYLQERAAEAKRREKH
ncbi:MAG: dephospho-CoA kinase [Desulfomonilia bacterium]|jgi:dephospho-CoA kinase|nr:dephospho-CoA kinase [Desulfomonilia bacterium]HPW68294.1 dephospho-CoA kinase [Deltaproteobacteria bacterium]